MSRGRGPVAMLLAAALVATLAVQAVVRQRRDVLVPPPKSVSRLSGLDTFALSLVLGGLRGPLAMALWHSVEEQKIDRNLEDVDTKIELIRMLQAEFDQVHIFQIWNKAYNLSVQMASLPNKYATILSALDYARSADAERPDNVNILYAIADVYFNKLGDSAEKRYYTPRLRQETRAAPEIQQQTQTPGRLRRIRHQPLLDAGGFLLPQYLQPRMAPLGSGPDAYNGAELQYLARYNTADEGGFPYGVSPFALAYNYCKRANELSRATGQRHLQLSEAVLDSRGAIALNKWSYEERERALQAELRAAGRKIVPNRGELEVAAIDLPWAAGLSDASADRRDALAEAIFSFRRSAHVCAHAVEEYRRHVANQTFYNTFVYLSHIDTMLTIQYLSEADLHYASLLSARTAFSPPLVPPERADALRAEAARWYRKAIDQSYFTMLKYYVEEAVSSKLYPEVTQKMLGRGYDRNTLHQADPSVYPALRKAVDEHYRKLNQRDPLAEDSIEFLTYIHRAQQRLERLQ